LCIGNLRDAQDTSSHLVRDYDQILSPGLGPLFNVAWLRRDPNLGQIGTGVRRLNMRRKEPHRLYLTALRQSRQAVALCAC
jgi:hypothetical protein